MTDLQPELAAALVAFQAAAPSIAKRRTANMGTYSYRYADLSDIWDSIRESLSTNGIAVTQMLTGGGQGFIGIKTTLWHTSGQTHSETVELPVNARSPQEVGSAITYYKRYALSAALGLSTEEDDDGAAASRERPHDTATPKIGFTPVEKARDRMLAKLQPYGWTADKLIARYQADYGTDLRTVTDVKVLNAFTQVLVDEAEAERLDEQAKQELAKEPLL